MPTEAELRAAYASARATWPSIALTFEQFAERVEALDVGPRDLADRAADLLLATACAAGDRNAQKYLDTQYLMRLDELIGRPRLERHLLDELQQKVRLKLLTGDSPAIARYAGRGPLTSWLRVTAARVASDVLTAAGQATRHVDLLDQLVSGDPSPELEVLLQRHRGDLRAALEASFAGLPARDRTLLRLHFLEDLNIEQIGAIYQVHRATVARWLVAIRQRVFSDLCDRFALCVGTSSSEVRSLIGLLREDLHVSARRILGGTTGA